MPLVVFAMICVAIFSFYARNCGKANFYKFFLTGLRQNRLSTLITLQGALPSPPESPSIHISPCFQLTAVKAIARFTANAPIMLNQPQRGVSIRNHIQNISIQKPRKTPSPTVINKFIDKFYSILLLGRFVWQCEFLVLLLKCFK